MSVGIGTTALMWERFTTISTILCRMRTRTSVPPNFVQNISAYFLSLVNRFIITLTKPRSFSSARLKKLEKQLCREQRCLSRKYENLKKGESTQKNIQKQKLKVQKLYHKINNIRTDYINKTIAEIVKTKPSYITIEDLNIKGMMKNRHLSKAIASQKFYEFRTKLKAKCDENGIELRVVDRWYPSSKICHHCGAIKKDLKLSDRIYRCDCGYIEDRDFNAALNLRDALTYKVV